MIVVSVIIKAYNEERHIRASIESALFALNQLQVPGEVILADSLSTDGTVAAARSYPIKIVQLADSGDRSCGVGAQLGYLAAKGKYLYILDGDMTLAPDFLPKAIDCLDADESLAGVAGIVEEKNVSSSAFLLRAQNTDTRYPSRTLCSLNMGGLYRRSAIDALGYFTNKNLHAFEEFELGARLISAGWRLERIGVNSVQHFGPLCSSAELIGRRWRSKYSFGHGELLRSSLGMPYFGLVVRNLRVLHVQAAVVFLWLAIVLFSLFLDLGFPQALSLSVFVWGAMFLFVLLRKRSTRRAIFSLVAWHVGVAGFLRGVLSRPNSHPSTRIDFRELPADLLDDSKAFLK